MRATYRLQLGPDLSFDAARALVPHLARLGVSHLYLSPSASGARPPSARSRALGPAAEIADLTGPLAVALLERTRPR